MLQYVYSGTRISYDQLSIEGGFTDMTHIVQYSLMLSPLSRETYRNPLLYTRFVRYIHLDPPYLIGKTF